MIEFALQVSSAATHQPFVFTPGSTPVAAGATDPLVSETRREIADIVREVAAAVRSDRSSDQFLSLLVDRVLRAMAAEGVLVWQKQDAGVNVRSSAYRCVKRLGRITDQSFPPESIATHDCLLREVAREGQPVVVPATPGAADPDAPANPMDVPAAIVPIECEPSTTADYLLQAFLEPDCGVATQRGYLRFVAQMADLAGEFLRADQLRGLRHQQALAVTVDQAIAEIHRIDNLEKLQAAIVDQIASIFGFDRVGLCRLERRARLEAVSHVTVIDRGSTAAAELRDAAVSEVSENGLAWYADDDDLQEHAADDDTLTVRAIIRIGKEPHQTTRSIVCMQVADRESMSTEHRAALERYIRHVEIALHNVSRLDAIPGARLVASLAPSVVGRGRRWRARVAGVLLITLLIAIACFPVPLVVYARATVRPAIVRTMTAPRDAVVDQIHVSHGQSVSQGDPLLTLSDPVLDGQITTLMGRRAVLVQQQSHWTSALVDTASSRLDAIEQAQAEQRLVAEEIRSIDDQLAVLERARDSLLLLAPRDGIVDAWQIEQRLQARPLRRGDLLVQVVAERSPWVVDVQVPQSRIAHVQTADRDRSLTARVALESNPHKSYEAAIDQFGPAMPSAQNDAVPATSVLLRLQDEASGLVASRQTTGYFAGAPARVMFHCGKTPAACLLFQDVIRSLRGTWALYMSHDSTTNSGNTSGAGS